jgi:hypothetical protein
MAHLPQKTRLMPLPQLIGLAGPPLFLYAYAMVSLGKWKAVQLRFHLLNFLGALAILYSLTAQWNLAICILECCWASVSVVGMMRSKIRG